MTTITIGRHENNTLVLTDSTVSAHHAQLIMDDDAQHGRLQDLLSTNGTYVNDTRIVGEVVVSLDDKLRFGRHECLVRDLLPQPETPVSETPLPQEEEPKTVLTSGLSDFKLIGKSEDCDITLSHDDVSRHHAKISRTSVGRVLLEDLGSTNGTYVNGQLVTKQLLRKGDKVTITRNYPLDWELIYPVSADAEQQEQQKAVSRRRLWMIVASVALVLALGVSCYLLFSQHEDNKTSAQNTTVSSVDLYKQYNSAVCLIVTTYKADVYCNGMKLGVFEGGAEGTGFFISKRGQIGTNQHVARPWLALSHGYEEEKAAIEQLGLDKYGFDAHDIDIRNHRVTECFALLNGDKAQEKNCIELKTTCLTYDDNPDIDVAVLQTKNKRLPDDVAIVDLSIADPSRNALTEGKTIYLIGYPYGSDAALNDNMVIHNQIQEGRITQKRGKVDFGHSIPGTHGASGSPIFDEQGHLVGIHYACIDNVEGLYYGIKVQYLLDLLE